MESHLLTIILDVVLVALLAAAILFGLKLNRHLSALRQSREELKGLLEEFARSTDRAEAALDGLKRGARENIAAVKETVDQAERLKDDLVFLTKRGEEAADRLESGITAARKGGAAPKEGGAAAASDEEPPPPKGGARGKAKKKSDLLRALQGMR
ncbi:MAG: DUF6468 domain-containing protein [Marivibrio sp.]|uniref:DUF6468 domain-containing protein n=1 Tax=Marivibrio sp. TaxID=2039719 RepID=UPI0032EDF52F